MILAKDIMTAEVVTVGEDTPISEAARLMTERHVSGLPVLTRAGELVGIVCESDIVDQGTELHLPTVINLMGYIVFLESSKKLEKELKKKAGLTCRDIMSSPVKTVDPETPLVEIATLMTKARIHSIPVVSGRNLVGIVGKKDIVRALSR